MSFLVPEVLVALGVALLPHVAAPPLPVMARQQQQQQRQASAVQNPVFDGADPHAAVFGDRVWIYPTGGSRGRDNFFAWHSPDLVNWTRVGPIFDFEGIAWTKADGRPRHGAWAPCIAFRNGRYYLYYSVGPQDEQHPSRIGVAVSDSPAGPFRDSGQALLTGGDGFEAIDPMVYHDPKGDKWYLYAGGSAGAKLRVFELGDDMGSLKREIEVDTPPQFTEGAFMHDRDGVYYLTYSHGGWRDATYSVHYATGKSPLGPWEYRGAILVSDAKHKGPGHHSIIQNGRTGKWYIVYHRWNAREGDGPYEGSRAVAIEEMTYDENGLIRPIQMTDAGPAAVNAGR